MEILKQQTQPLNGSQRTSAKSSINDQFGRTFNYLRIAVNEHCNLRCIYCMPEEGIHFRTEERLLKTEEICRIIEIMSGMGGIQNTIYWRGTPVAKRLTRTHSVCE